MDLKIFPAEDGKIKEALGKLETLTISASKKTKIENLIKNSQYNGIYCEYFLAEDPIEFRNSLPHNQEFNQQAEELELNLEVLAEGVEDEPVTIVIDAKNVLLIHQKKLENYVNDAFKILFCYSGEFYSHLSSSYFFDKSVGIDFKDFYKYEYYGVEISAELELDIDISSVVSYLKNCSDAPRSWIKAVKEHLKSYNFDLNIKIKKIQDVILEETLKVIKNFYVDFIKSKFGKAGNLIDLYQSNGKINYSDLVKVFDESLFSICDSIAELLENFQYEENYTQEKYTQESTHFILFEGEKMPNLNDLIIHIDDLKYEVLQRSTPSSKLKSVKSAEYHVQLEQLLPEDITFGNDGGCCIATSKESCGNGDSVPFFQLDNGTYVFGIYHKINGRKPQRVGMILAFATKDLEDEPVLLCNSLELSGSYNPLSEEGFSKLVSHANDYLHKFAKEAGFNIVAMGTHTYNTGRNYMDDEKFEEPDFEEDELLKLPDVEDHPKFYSEVLTDVHSSSPNDWSYLTE